MLALSGCSKSHDEADNQSHAAQAEVEKLSNEVVELGKQVDQATAELNAAKTDAERDAAKAKLDALRQKWQKANHRCIEDPLRPGHCQ